MKKKQVKFKDVPVGTVYTQTYEDARSYSFRKVRVPVTYIDRDYEGDDEMEAARGMGDCADFYYPVGDDEICTIEVDPPHEIVVRREYFDQDICPVCNSDGYECPACSEVRGQKADGYECPQCSVISTERAENDEGRLICSVCGYVSGDVPKTPACIII